MRCAGNLSRQSAGSAITRGPWASQKTMIVSGCGAAMLVLLCYTSLLHPPALAAGATIEFPNYRHHLGQFRKVSGAPSPSIPTADRGFPAKPVDGRGMNRLGRAYVINLEHRRDRLANFTQVAASLNINNYTIVQGVQHECGELGVALAHIVALQQCWAAKDGDSCLIMEDDFTVRAPANTAIAMVDTFLDDVRRWDVLMLSCNAQLMMQHDGHGFWCPTYVLRVVKGLSTSAYAIKRTYVPSVVAAFLESVAKLKNDCGVYNAIDVNWFDLQARDVWYAFVDADEFKSTIGYQAASFSDVTRKNADYGGVR